MGKKAKFSEREHRYLGEVSAPDLTLAVASRKLQTRDFEFCEGGVAIAVFGSGYLLDFPVELLDRPNCKIFLFDAVHPKSITSKKYRASVEFVTADLNDEMDTYKNIFTRCEKFVSLNVLSQLALMPFLKDQNVAAAEARVAQHLRFLRDLAKPALLISDFEKRFVNTLGDVILTESTLHNVKLAPPDHQWVWDLAPLGEISKEYRVELAVGSWHLT